MEEQNNYKNKKLLIVEDEEMLRELYVQIFKEAGYEVDSASDGEEAFAKMNVGGYDLVLLDIVLPKKDGVQILKDLQKFPPKTPNKSVVMLTNLGQEALNGDTIPLGVSGVIVKSDYTPDQLLEEVRKKLSN
jgi:DNA-binding response OmpR family regulator